MWLILLLTCFAGLIIIYQDFKSRAVIWFIFPVLLMLGIFFNLAYQQSVPALLKNSLVNIALLMIQLLLLQGYFYFKKNRAAIMDKIGWGDLFFLLASCFFFSPLNFLLFYMLSLGFSLIGFLVFSYIQAKGKRNSTIPLAGLQSVFLIIFLITNMVIQNNVTTDDWIVNCLTLYEQ